MLISIAAAYRRALVLSWAVLMAAALLASPPSLARDASQKAFATPKAAVDALVAAAASKDASAALAPILGPDSGRILSSGDPVADHNALSNFLAKYNQMHRLAYDADGDVILYIGAENWPMPIPLVKRANKWVFDTAAGEKELLYRRIGANELYTIDVLHNLVAAQQDYARRAAASSGRSRYAQKILSAPGKHDGLYWPVAEGEPQSPIGPLIAKAVAQGYKRGAEGRPVPFHGYFYRVLTEQGKEAPGGAMSYLQDGEMTRGFAFLAFPAEYGSSGVMTFMVNQDGIVLEKDLGPETAQIASRMARYDSGSGWQQADSGDSN